MSTEDYSKLPSTTVPAFTTTRAMDGGYPGFPMSIVVTGFFVTSLAYLVCFCCCIIQFFVRRSREMRQSGNAAAGGNKRNDTLKRRFLKQFRNSLRKLQRTPTGNVNELQMVREMSSLGTTGSCTICFEDYAGDPATILIGKIKSCGHFYHFECIWTWLESKRDCPLCRGKAELTEEDITALALRHVLHELKDLNEVKIEMPSQSDGQSNQPDGKSDLPDGQPDGQSDGQSETSCSQPETSSKEGESAISDSCQVTLDVVTSIHDSPSKGVSNQGFDDVDLNDEPSVQFTVGDDLPVKS